MLHAGFNPFGDGGIPTGGIVFGDATGQPTTNVTSLSWNNTNLALTVGNARIFTPGAITVGRNLFIGESAGNFVTTGTENVGIGYLALNAVTGGVSPAGNFNTAVGSFSQQLVTSGYKNTSLGRSTLDNCTVGFQNTALGYGACHFTIDGSMNVGVGFEAVHDSVSGTNNIGVGAFSLWKTTGSHNSALGHQTLQNNVDGLRNTAIGMNALNANVSGSDTTALGYGAGVTSTGSGNIFIGQGADCSAGLTNVTVLGTGTTATSSNTLILGNSQNVGIATLGPGCKLDVNGVGRFQGSAAPSAGAGLELGYNSGGSITSFDRTGAAYTNLSFDSLKCFINGNSGGAVGIKTLNPRKQLDVLDASGAAQLRLTYTDNSVYVDLQTNSSGNLIITPSGQTVTLTQAGTVTMQVSSTSGQAVFNLTGNTFGQILNDVGDFFITNGAAAGAVILRTNSAEKARITAAGSVLVGTAALGTTATDGFLYIPTCAGAPTGVPTAATGRIAMIYDSTNNFFYFYNGGWKKSTVYA